MATHSLLLVDDDGELCELLVDYLQQEDFAVQAVQDAHAGLSAALSGCYDLVILDVMLPGMNGFDVLRRIRAACPVPVLMLSARGEEIDRILGLELGADDYLPKPFNPRELLARIRAVQRRSESSDNENGQQARPGQLVVGDIALDSGARIVRRQGKPVELTAVEFSLLFELMRQAGRVVSRDELTRKVLERQLTVFDRSIDVHVSNLRKKLGHEFQEQERIKTIRGVGYLYTLPGI